MSQGRTSMETQVTAFVVYDSTYGNTARVAEAIIAGLGGGAVSRRIDELDPNQLSGGDLLVVGSPTQGGRPTSAMQTWLMRLSAAEPEGIKVAAFDTRLAEDDKSFLFRHLVDLIGFAAPRIMRSLTDMGAVPICDPEGFTVGSKEGPLVPGELNRATGWGRAIATAADGVVSAA